MSLKIVISTFLLLVAVSLPFATAIKCYTCEHTGKSTDDNNCLTLANLQPSMCSNQIMRLTATHNALPMEIKRLLEVDIPPDSQQNVEYSCVKLVITGNEGRNNYTIRTCQTAPTEQMKFCNTANNQLRMNNNFGVSFCDECRKDECNGASTIAISFPIFAIFIIASYFIKA
ncbi:uncharacterized protein LOC127287230 [Leptopilina boulardi]|uniref:uncharacterized protein LOC127287230 n=1 Tax=Leptopilina boulardi TaxID=63433 RepID=UPI0021F5E361|nr:uncharacterized protein LOC127287230 [Leptopilina boulardi]